MLTHYPEALKTRYELEQLPETEHQLLEAIGRSRGCLRSGNRIDMDRVSKIFLTELRAGMIGRLSLETPPMMEEELIEVGIIREQKAAKKLARKQKVLGSN